MPDPLVYTLVYSDKDEGDWIYGGVMHMQHESCSRLCPGSWSRLLCSLAKLSRRRRGQPEISRYFTLALQTTPIM